MSINDINKGLNGTDEGVGNPIVEPSEVVLPAEGSPITEAAQVVEAATEVRANAVLDESERLKGVTIVFVADDSSIPTLGRIHGEESGATVLTFSSGVAFLEAIVKKEIPEDAVIVTDNNMPEKNGITCVREVREMGYKDLLIIMCSSMQDGDEEEVDKALKDGTLDDFLHKPFRFKNLINDIAFYKGRYGSR
jgi:CheY-like chemotaxis protein